MHRKGLSQILWLIIAAAVMMMLALALVFTGQGAIADIFGSSKDASCRNAIDARMTTMGTATSGSAPTATIPSTCFDSNSEPAIPKLSGCSPGDQFAKTSPNTWEARCS